MNSMFELWVQKEQNSEVKVYEVFAKTFDDAVTAFLNKFPNTYKITNPCIYKSE